MPQIYNKDIVALKLQEAIQVIASHRRIRVAVLEQNLAFELNGENLSPRTLKSWKNESSIPNTIDDGVFFAIIYLALQTNLCDLTWLTNLLRATSVPIYKPLSQQLLRAYLSQARFQGGSLSESEIMQVLELFFEENSNEPKGLGYVRKKGGMSLDGLQTLIPLDPVTSNFIKESKAICVEGITLFRFIEAFFHDFVYSLKNGATLKVILIEPTSSAIDMATFRSLSSSTKEVQQQRVISTINTLIRMKKVSNTPAVELRTFNYMPPYGITVYHHISDVNKSVCQVRLYAFKTPTPDAPTIISTASINKNWFNFFTEQFELMWKESKPYLLE